MNSGYNGSTLFSERLSSKYPSFLPDGELARQIRLMKNFGFAGNDTVDCIGLNGTLNEVSAAMGLTSLESVTDFISINRRNYKQYQEELAGLEGVTLLAYNEEQL